MIFQQFRHEEGGCLSYIVGCSRMQVCAIIDSQHDIEPYIKYAEDHGMRITHIIETHSQADHLSGAQRLAAATGASVYFHESVSAAFPVRRVKDGEDIRLGNVLFKVLHTPGHTPDSITLLVSDTARGREPWLALTGDTLFVGDTGRPDLDGDAGLLYDSIWGKLLPLGDGVEVYPAHFAGSSCGKSMSPKPSSTMGYERRFNDSLKAKSKKEFVDLVTADLPVQPPLFQKVRQYNLGFLKEPPIGKTYDMNSLEISPEKLKEKMDRGEKPFLLDVREDFEYRLANMGGQLIPLGELSKRYGELNAEAEIVVHCHHGGRSRKAVSFLYEKGFRNVKNLIGGIDAWSVKIDPKVPRY